MLKRIDIDNFQSLVDFEWKPERVNLLMGDNGTGKSAVLAVLHRLRRLLLDGEPSPLVFAQATRTRWGSRREQRVEIDLAGRSRLFRYRLCVTQIGSFAGQVLEEELAIDDSTEFTRRLDKMTLTARPSSTYDVDIEGSAIPMLKNVSLAVARFVEQLERLHVLSPRPAAMVSACGYEARTPAPDLSYFASWYRYLAQFRAPEMDEARTALRGVLDGFYGLRFRDSCRAPSRRKLATEWILRDGTKYALDLSELSEGQRALIALYTLLFAAGDEPAAIAIDEPDNFIALTAIQPWLGALSERPALQAILVSHHPDLLNFLAPDSGIVFHRDDAGPTRIERFSAAPDETLTPAELVARGWCPANPELARSRPYRRH